MLPVVASGLAAPARSYVPPARRVVRLRNPTERHGMHVLIYEPIFWGGHHLTYVRHLVRTIAPWVARVTVATGETAETSDAYTSNLQTDLRRAGTLEATIPAPARGADWGRHFYDHLVRTVERLKP